MNLGQAIILAMVEAATEFLPISSTAHLILTSKLLGLETTEFLGTFEVVIQLGAIAAVLILFAQKIWKNRDLWPKIIWAFIPTAILGALAYPFVKSYLLKGQLITGIMLILGGIVFLVWEKYWFKNGNRKEITEISNKKAATIGIWQAIAFIPGTSRSAVSVLGGMVAGLKRSAAVEFAFILAIPTMIAASGLDLVKTLYDGWQSGVGLGISQQDWLILAVGIVVTFLVSLLIVKWLIKFMSQKGSFTWFGIYRIVLGVIWLIVFWSK